MKQRLNYYLIKFILLLGRILPKSTVYQFTQWIFERYYRMKPRRVEIMHANIRRAFPDLEETEVVAFGKKVYRELSKTVAEYLLIYADRLHVKTLIVNREEAKEKLVALQSQNQSGMIIITGHYSNWELFGDFLGYSGFAITNVVKKSPDSLIDKRIITPFREKYGNRMIDQKGSMVRLAKALKNNQMVTLLIDQVVQPPNGVVVDFFGYPTAATKSVAMLKNKYDPIIVPVFLERVGEEQFIINIYDPVEYIEDENLSKEEQIVAMTQAYYHVLEKQITKTPEQWLWLYNRWKEIKRVS